MARNANRASLRVNDTWQAFGRVIHAHQSFTTPNKTLTGEAGEPGDWAYGPMLGRLPDKWREVFMQDRDQIDYVVYSYATPIAWRRQIPGFGFSWEVPAARYSDTTTQHQHTIRYAVTHPAQFG